MDTQRVIVAIASPPGPSMRGIVRLSGAACGEVVGRCVEMVGAGADAGAGQRAGASAGPRIARGVHRVRLRAPLPPIPAILLSMPGPASATGEDCAELHLPGNPHLLERVVEALVGGGAGMDGGGAGARDDRARRAEPGEFSARAVLHGRIGLDDAERIAAAIGAATDAQLAAAQALRAGAGARALAGQAQELAQLLALVEAGIDFTDQEDVVAIAPAALLGRARAVAAALRAAVARDAAGEAARTAPRVVLAGPPNAGKSALFNALLGRARTVESPERGTTRDAVVEALALDPPAGEVLLVDAPGLEEAVAAIDHAMQAQARAAIETADLVLWCSPENMPGMPGIFSAALGVRTKVDLATGAGDADGAPTAAIRTSARTGEGLAQLRVAIARALDPHGAGAAPRAADEARLGTLHRALVEESAAAVEEAAALVAPHAGARALRDPELVAAALRVALDRLGAVAGEIPPDEVLGRLFARFCIGK
ncbi:MAG: GTPase [Phycisphaerales bacterium]